MIPVTRAEKQRALKLIASKEIWVASNKPRFVKFGMYFWGNQKKGMDVNYVMDWVKRFNRNDEYIYADSERLKHLIKVDGKKEAKRRAEAQFKLAGWKAVYIESQLKNMGL